MPLLLAGWSCSPSTGSSGLGQNTGSNGNAGYSGNAGATGVAGGGIGDPGSSGGSGDLIGLGTAGSNGSGSPDAGCFATASKAEQVTVPVTTTTTTSKPVDMYILYDQSGSMNEKNNGVTKWTAISNALQGFVNSPQSAGIGMGIGYFPFVLAGVPPFCSIDSDCGQYGPCTGGIPFGTAHILGNCSQGDACSVASYATPDVPIDFLPAVAPKIIASINAHGPGGGTPTTPALTGAHQIAGAWAAAHPDRKTIVVLATDGDPTGCSGNSVQDVANVAQGAFQANPSVETFVVGVGSSLTSLNAIAAAGGTTQALIVDVTTGDPTQQFLDAMNKIRETVTVSQTTSTTVNNPVPCTWTIPPAPGSQTFDPNKVNVDFISGGSTQPFGFVNSQADCANVVNGWYFDNPASPGQVLVCPQTCTMVQAATDAEVSVVFGCKTVTALPR